MTRHRVVMLASALAVIGMVIGPISAQAGASRRSGEQDFRLTIYEVGTAPHGIGPVRADGVIDGRGMDQGVDSAPTDPPHTNRDILTFRNGTLTVVSTQTGNGPTPKVDENCNASFKLPQQTTVVAGTGAYANASGQFRDEIHVDAVLPRNPDGSCNQNSAPLFDTVHVEAEGHLSI